MPDQRLPTIEYQTPEPPKRFTISLPVGVAIIVASIPLLFFLFYTLPANHRSEKSAQVKCASNLRQIGQAMQLYAHDHNGVYPPSLALLPQTEQISYDVFICPLSSDVKAAASTTQPVTAIFAQPGHCSYIYLGQNLTPNCSPDCIIAFDDPANHNLQGTPILFGDGHLESFDLPTVMHLLAQLDQGINPPSQPTASTPILTQAAAERLYKTRWQSRMPALKTGQSKLPATRPSMPSLE